MMDSTAEKVDMCDQELKLDDLIVEDPVITKQKSQAIGLDLDEFIKEQ